MTYTSDLVEGLADLLSVEALGVYRPTTPYLPAETAIAIGVMPAGPDRVWCLTPYPVLDTGTTDAITAVQVRIRDGRNPTAVQARADALFALLDGRTHYQFRGVHVSLSWRNSEAFLGPDANSRCEITANYYFRTNRSTPFTHE
ncbi:minor capsid protein [Streptomyces sp. NPDC056500]|uniref:minor capsid protein n=1 Tax=Streptomyces sp. NPDC056500 TaxID=3345840 RepID=UPI0036A07260